jgi:hypothetical protein
MLLKMMSDDFFKESLKLKYFLCSLLLIKDQNFMRIDNFFLISSF